LKVFDIEIKRVEKEPRDKKQWRKDYIGAIW
jgi:hypothetical protein